MLRIVKDKRECRFDMVSLGEVMLRLDPGDTRVRCACSFQVWEGEGEYNVARGLKNCLRIADLLCFHNGAFCQAAIPKSVGLSGIAACWE